MERDDAPEAAHPTPPEGDEEALRPRPAPYPSPDGPAARPGGAPRAPADGRRWLRALLLALTTSLAVLALWKAVTWPDVARLATTDPETTAFIERWRAAEARRGASPEAAWDPVPYGAISPHLKQAVLVAEDIGFFSHGGFAPEEIRAALAEAWEERRFPRGASTLTQQLAKNLWLSPSRSPLRKLEEAILTLELEHHLGKRRILELYLNVVELGEGIYGAEAAAQHYFGVPAAALDEHQAALLAAALPRPGSWNPARGGAAYRRRAARIERRMERARWLREML